MKNKLLKKLVGTKISFEVRSQGGHVVSSTNSIPVTQVQLLRGISFKIDSQKSVPIMSSKLARRTKKLKKSPL